jgi:hypothetical protein
MINQVKLGTCMVLAAAAAFLSPIAKADNWNRRTVMTFSEPVEIPGKVLPAGTYVFKLADSQSDRTIVRVFTADEAQVLATVLAVTDYRLDTPEKTTVTFEERASGSPEALHSWFCPGDNYGVEFVYGKKDTTLRTFERPEVVAAAPAAEPEPPATPAVEAPAPEPPAPVIETEPQPVVAAEAEPEPEPQPAPAELPKTAGNFLLFPILGVTLLAGGFAALRLAKQS